MSWLLRHKNNGIGLGLLFIFFAISVFVRQPNLITPLRTDEWITAHTLITAEIWDENGGPSNFAFSPIYTYPGEGNGYREMLGGVVAENGEVYYVSYPPFSFLFYYYTSHLMGGPSIISIRILALFIHLITCVLIFLFVGKITQKKEEKPFNFGGLIAAGLYLFARGNLWFHGNLYFADTLVQPLFIGGLLVALNYYTESYKRERSALIVLFIIFFLSSYTEWLGILSAFVTGTIFLVLAIWKKEKKWLKPFFTVAAASVLALGISLAQYTSIDGWKSLKTTTTTKYSERSGYSTTVDSAKEFNVHNGESFHFLISNFDNNYKRIENYLGFAFGIFVLVIIIQLFRKKKKPLDPPTSKPYVFALLILILPILLHYILLFNFNAVHQFAAMKTVSMVTIIIGLLIYAIQTNLTKIHPYLNYAIVVFFSFFFIVKAYQAVESYTSTYAPEKMISYPSIASAKIIREQSGPDIAVFSNLNLYPNIVYYTKHIFSPLPEFDTTTITQIMEMRRNKIGHYYQHEDFALTYKITFELIDHKLVILDTLDYR